MEVWGVAHTRRMAEGTLLTPTLRQASTLLRLAAVATTAAPAVGAAVADWRVLACSHSPAAPLLTTSAAQCGLHQLQTLLLLHADAGTGLGALLLAPQRGRDCCQCCLQCSLPWQAALQQQGGPGQAQQAPPQASCRIAMRVQGRTQVVCSWRRKQQVCEAEEVSWPQLLKRRA